MNARDYAWHALATAGLPGWNFDPSALRFASATRPPDPRDFDLSLALTRVVTKNAGLLTHLVGHYSGRRLTQVHPGVQIILALGLAQLRFFDRLPSYAVVDEAVEQSKRLEFAKAAGFVNAVLRRALREPNAPLPGRDDAQEYARVALSCPPQLFKRLIKLVGVEKALAMAERQNAEAPLVVRGTPGSVEGVTVTPHARAGFSVVTGATEAVLTEWARAGVAQPQDPTSAAVVDRMELAAATRVLDRCCGVGTKTLQIAAAAPAATVVAVDTAGFRTDALDRAAAARGLTNVRTVTAATVPADEPAFDRILVDVPCSNSGVLIRRPEARYRQDDRSLKSLDKLQKSILADTVPRLAPGGLLVYSTCSVWDEENGDQVRWLTQQFPHLKVEDVQTALPATSSDAARHHDGGFYAVLQST